MARSRSADDDLFGPEYAVVRLRASWTTLAYLCAALCMSARYWMRLVPFEYGWRRPFATVVVMLALAVVGTASALWAHRSAPNGVNKIAILCNAVALLLALTAVVILGILMP